jgi:transcriptional regulator with XRE-family HTH domain
MTEILIREARRQARLSLREAAQQLSISHAYLAALELGHKPLSAKWTEDLKGLYKLPATSILIQPIPIDEEVFVSWLRSQVKWWDSRFIMPTVPGVTKLVEDLYVSPSFSEGQEQFTEAEFIRSLFEDQNERAVLLTGRIGAGKSFFLRRLTIKCGDFPHGKGVVPVMVSLGGFAELHGNFCARLSQYYCAQGFDGSATKLELFLRNRAGAGKLLLLLDGLDEIQGQRERVEVFSYLQREFEDVLRPKGNRLLVSGRTEAFYERDALYTGFRTVSLDNWTPAQVLEAMSRWSFRDSHGDEEFFRLLKVNDFMYNLAGWPLLFHLLATLHTVAGLRPFQGRSGLCDDCCRVLENTWGLARRTFRPVSESHSQPMPWIRWRQFIVFAMRELLRVRSKSANPFGLDLSIPFADMQSLWERFLSERGVQAEGLGQMRISEYFRDQDRIGPIYLAHGPSDRASQSGTGVYRFLDPAFGHFYYGQALAQDVHTQDEQIRRNLRHQDWEDVIAFAIEELGLSDRLDDNASGEQMINYILSLDDEMRLEHQPRVDKSGIGHYSAFIAMRAILPYNAERFRETVITPFLDIHMKSMFVQDAETAHQILGECSASPWLRQYFIDELEKLERSGGLKDSSLWERKWRVLTGLGRFGEKLQLIATELVSDLESYCKSSDPDSPEPMINVRRLMLCLRHLGRLYALEQGRNHKSASAESDGIARVSAAVANAVSHTMMLFRDQIDRDEFHQFSGWHVLNAILVTQSTLKHRDALKHSLNLICNGLPRPAVAFYLSKRYRHSSAFIQFLKGFVYYNDQIVDNWRRDTGEETRAILASSDLVETEELEIVLEMLHGRSDRMLPYERFFAAARVDGQKQLDTLIKVIEMPFAHTHVALGLAVYGIRYFDDRAPGTWAPESKRVEVIGRLLNLLEIERTYEVYEQDVNRIYTAPYLNYSFPLYDHIYDCIVQLARSLPLVATRDAADNKFVKPELQFDRQRRGA